METSAELMEKLSGEVMPTNPPGDIQYAVVVFVSIGDTSRWITHTVETDYNYALVISGRIPLSRIVMMYSAEWRELVRKPDRRKHA